MWLTLGLLGLAVLLSMIAFRLSHFYRLASLLPTSKGIPILGIAHRLWVEKDEMLTRLLEILAEKENKDILATHGLLAVWLGPVLIVLIDNLEDIEQIMMSKQLTRKSYQYKFFEPWLGKGLFTSSGQHWQSHRKLITPAFHFSMLEKFIPIFNANIEIYLQKLDEKVGKGVFNMESYVTYLSLDIISETSMSAKINAQREESIYAHKVKDLTEIISLRVCRIVYYPDFIFNLSKLGQRQKKSKDFVDSFIHKLVMQRKRERDKIHTIDSPKSNDYGDKRKGLMDLLLEKQSSTQLLSDQDILDEINTFMFGGHDTITSGINFTLYLLSKHPDIQEEVHKEIVTVVGQDSFTLRNLQELKYLERVIKETLRVLPVAPFAARSVDHDFKLKSGFTLPAGCTLLLFFYRYHRNPNIFPDPEKFDPDRFLPENCAKRNPYAYMPFSAGPRNCLGQKFAMLEMKAIIAATVRRYKLLPSNQDIKPVIHIILRSANGINLALQHR